MPKKSTKSKSKRVTLKQKYKVLRKVREHHRKTRKDAKKLGLKKRAPKDPGIPNAWPFKQELIQQLAAQKERAAEHMRKVKEESWKRAQEALRLEDEDTMANVSYDAAERAAAFEAQQGSPGGPTHVQDYSRRAYYKDFVKVAEAADVILEVIDARDPEGGRCRDVERFVRRLGANKRVILLLNKIDLVPKDVLTAWLKHLREELPTVPFKSSTQQQARNLSHKQIKADVGASLRGSECLGADTLLELLKNYARNAGLKSSLTVGVVGLPNVGKSSVINSLKRTRVAQVGNTPGVTRSVQAIHLDKQITLLDSPGVVFADPGKDGIAAAALRNCVKIEQLEDPVLPVVELVRRCPVKQLMVLYRTPAFKTAEEFLQQVGLARGKLKKGGTVDLQAAARIVLQDWNDGRIPYYTLPPSRKSELPGTAAVVSEWGAEFNPDLVNEDALIASLPDEQAGGFAVESFGDAGFDPAAADFAGEEEEEEEEEMEEEDASHNDGTGSSGSEDMDEGDLLPSRTVRPGDKQNAQLYTHDGQFNPHVARAAKKQQKKQKQRRMEAGGDDYDFDEDWA